MCVLNKYNLELPLTSTKKAQQSPGYLINKLDSIVPLQRLDRHSSGIDELGQVYGLGRVNTAQIDQVLQSFQWQRLVLRTSTKKNKKDKLVLMRFSFIFPTETMQKSTYKMEKTLMFYWSFWLRIFDFNPQSFTWVQFEVPGLSKQFDDDKRVLLLLFFLMKTWSWSI